MIIPKANKKKSVVKKGKPNKIKLVLKTSNLNKGFPLGNLINGKTTNKTNNNVEVMER